MDDTTSYHDATAYYEHPSERLVAMRRTVAKALNSSGHSNFYSSDYHCNDYCDESNSQNPKPKLDELVNTIVFSLMRQSMEYLKQPEGEAAMACLVGLLARAVSRFVVTEQAKVAIRASAKEATAGLWDGFHRKMDEVVMKVPRVVLWLGLIVVGTYGVLLAVGLLLCLWRFTLYGLVQEKNIW